MPQMKPMNWLALFLYFTIMFIMMNNNLYFFNYKKFMFHKIDDNNLKYIKFKFKLYETYFPFLTLLQEYIF